MPRTSKATGRKRNGTSASRSLTSNGHLDRALAPLFEAARAIEAFQLTYHLSDIELAERAGVKVSDIRVFKHPRRGLSRHRSKALMKLVEFLSSQAPPD